jgi:hypothetical protein
MIAIGIVMSCLVAGVFFQKVIYFLIYLIISMIVVLSLY